MFQQIETTKIVNKIKRQFIASLNLACFLLDDNAVYKMGQLLKRERRWKGIYYVIIKLSVNTVNFT